MTGDLAAARADAVERALAALARVERCGTLAWRCECEGTVVDARLGGEWLWLDACAAAAGQSALAPDPWSCLASNADLSGAVRFVLSPELSPRLRADAVLESASSAAERVFEACTDLLAAARGVLAPPRRAGTTRPTTSISQMMCTPHPTARGAAATDVGVLLEETGWPCRRRGDGSWAADVDVPGQFLQAVVGSGDPRTAVDLAVEPAGVACRAAVAILLLRAGDEVRLVRPSVRRERLRFDVGLPSGATAADAAHALAALSVACRLAAGPVELLAQDEDLARAYLGAVTTSVLNSQPKRKEEQK